MSGGLISIADARERLLRDVRPLESETIPLEIAQGRILAADVKALRTQPPFPVSAMDGYAVRAADLENPPTTLRVIGQAAAGHPFSGRIGPGETVRIFTGGVVPPGADTILIQENAIVSGKDRISTEAAETAGRYVRPAGLDFCEDEVLLSKGTSLDPGGLCLAAAANQPAVRVYRRPRLAILATGDELLSPGSGPGPGQIIASNSYGVSALAREAGADVTDLGIARDTKADLDAALDRALELSSDILVSLGGASVGDHDLVQETFVAKGMKLDFWRIAMRPGKPLMLGKLNSMRILGLPGNPVSSLVCAHLFLKPLVEALGGRRFSENWAKAVLDRPLAENDRREDFLRAKAWRDEAGQLRTRAFDIQDSSMIRVFADSDVLIRRAPFAAAAAAGEEVEVFILKAAEL